MTSASMIPAAVTFLMMVMVIAMYIRIISQIACKQCVHRIISTSADTAEKTNACLRKCILCTAADTAADQGIHPMLHQKSSAPCPLPLVSTTSAFTTLPSATS